ncbi:alpha/beta hydrolase [Sphingobacterium humi]|uniref:Alpha/beta fold hydrolase n=1 Tax=Sphingobacterium humi TaxID=1796905 RepID=A0A6N8L7F0_9SPHI|nr:alpha/beta hydrolase [Sphingobacterium humi]MVZ64118.1 alpha/beta fold hydrolase [Sphingobacterium humi]
MDRKEINDKLAKELYIFSGLGADERVFQRLDFSGFSVTFIKWLEPLDRETIENYTTRLLDQVTTVNPILIGLSFGGMIAVEAAKQIDTERVILLSSAKTKHEIPFYYRFAGSLSLHKLLPTWTLKKPNILTNWFFGTHSAFDRQLLKQILTDTDADFLKWAIDKIVCWKNRTLPINIFHVHGTDDRILPLKFIAYDKAIKNAGHLMTLNRAEELNKIILQELEEKEP